MASTSYIQVARPTPLTIIHNGRFKDPDMTRFRKFCKVDSTARDKIIDNL